MAVSDKRNLDYEELVQSARGDRGIELHKTLMVWCHGHVAHRKSRDSESVKIYADYLDADPDVLDSVRVQVTSSGGPPVGSHFALEFADHVKALRDTV